jgi:RHS repeat-associated protein
VPKHIYQRVGLLTFLAVFIATLIAPSAYALQEEQQAQHQPAANSHIRDTPKQVDPKQDYAGALATTQPASNPAADYQAKSNTATTVPGVQNSTDSTVQSDALQSAVTTKKTYKAEEITTKRTATSSTFRNTDGSYTTKQYADPIFYKNSGNWEKIDTGLVEDKNAGDSGNIFGKALGQVESWLASTTTYTVRANDWQARFAATDAEQGMIRIKKGGSQVSFSPKDGKSVAPVVTTENGKQMVRYNDVWPGIDLEYIVGSDSLKENIIIKNKDATSNVAFTVSGASLQKTKTADGDMLAVTGALDNKFAVQPANLILNTFGLVTDHSKFSQTYKDGVLSVAVNSDYLARLPNTAFPAVIDPTVSVWTTDIGTRASGNYVSFKSDGYICYSTECNPYAGSLTDVNGIWRNWRSTIYTDYSFLKGKQVNNVTLHLTKRNASFYTGTPNSASFYAYAANCLGYECLGAASGSATFTTTANLDVTNIYASAVSSNNWDQWVALKGTEGTTETFKNFDPDSTSTYFQFTFTDAMPEPTITSPTNKQAFVDPQVSFSSSTHTVPATGAPAQYGFCVSTSGTCSGAVMVSTPQTTPNWTIPDGILQDGTTYYVQARTYDPATDVYSTYGPSKEFKVDLRTGKDSTQAYDTLGPVSADLATGNMSTSASSHTSSALGGSLGVSLDYNSPLRSRNGLVGKYYNSTDWTGATALTRVDQAVNFDWGTGSPAASTITSDNFSARWTGYFVAPVAGTYTFGGLNDDNMTVEVNNQTMYNTSFCSGTVCWGSNTLTLSAGQVVPITISYIELTGSAVAKAYVKGPISAQPIQSNWLQTGVRSTSQQYGLTGYYYKDNGTHDFTNAANTMYMQRVDPLVSFNWGHGPAATDGPSDNFLIRWKGYITVPTTGTYYFGTQSDDGSRIYIGTASTQVFNKWQDDPNNKQFGSSITLTAGQSVPITVEYYEHTGDAAMALLVKGAVDEQVVPSNWLSPKAQTLPAGWDLGVDADGNVGYDYLRADANSAVLTDASGSTHEYKWSGGTYTPPANEDGHLLRNPDGTFTLQDSDGRTYVFNTDGTISSVTSPVDDAKPAALQYTYGGTPSRLTQITDGVTANRWTKVYYSGDANCATAPTGFDAAAPTGMLCAVKTNDGRATNFFYKSGNLARIQMPGNEITDYGYDTLGRITSIRDSVANDAIAAGVRADDVTANTTLAYDDIGRISSVTQPAATAGAARTQHTLAYLPGTSIYYGATEQHVVGASEPNGYSHRVEYDNLFRTVKDIDIAGLADLTEWDPQTDLVLSKTDETGLKSTTVYDGEDRAVAQYGPAPAAWYNTWKWQLNNNQILSQGQSITSPDARFVLALQSDGNLVEYGPTGAIWSSNTSNGYQLIMQPDGNLVLYSSTGTPVWSSNSLGDPTAALRIQNDGNLVVYNSYGISVLWSSLTTGLPMGTTRYSSSYNTPLSAYAAQVAKTTTAYDGGIQGPNVSYYTLGTASKTLTGAPKLHSTNLKGSNTGEMSTTMASPISGTTDNWGFRTTGRIRLPATGQYAFRISSDGGVRVYIDDQLLLDDWNDGANRAHPNFTYDNVTGSAVRFRIEYYHKTGSPNFTLYMTPPGGSETSTVAQYVSPDYSLTTSSTSYDAALGNTTTTTNYGSNPELGLAQSTTTDPTGLNLTASNTYETQGATGSHLRQTSKSLPGGETTNYAYYASGETRDNPCTTGTVEAYDQGGQIKLKTEPDPDGTGTQTSRTAETVYDDAGRVVATRYNSDSWTCTTYDSRGRVLTTVVPAYSGSAARTITNDYAVSGNPLVTGSSDNFGPITTAIDLLGRTTSYTDIYGDTTTSTYDNYGKLTQRVSPMGTEVYEYDTYNRLTNQKLDGTTLASVTYDAFGRINYITYPTAGSQKETYTYSTTTGKVSQQTYTLGDGTSTVSDTVSRSQSGQITADTQIAGGVTTNSTYGYDGNDRLTSATVGSNTYGYGFGTENASCGTGSGTNVNAGKSGNRTTQTVNGTTTYFCYDNADKLTSSSNTALTTPTYDSHGNTLTLGTSTSKSIYAYDSSDRNKSITNSDGTKATYYDRDVQGRMVARYHDVSGVTTDEYYYSYTASGDTPDYVRNASWQIAEKYIDLPGDIQLTIRPLQTGNAKNTYSLANIHGDTIATTNTAGTLTGSYVYDPFGQVIGSATPNNQAGTASNAWVGNNQKLTETDIALNPTQMGARVYLASTGRFLQVDPVEGGGDNNYSYPNDPVGDQDLSGMCPWCIVILWAALRAYPYVYAALNEVNASYGGADSSWSSGAVGSARKNMSSHFAKHAVEIGAKDIKAYNRSARNVAARPVALHRYADGRMAYRDARGRITVLDKRGRIVTHFKPANVGRYWNSNVKRR